MTIEQRVADIVGSIVYKSKKAGAQDKPAPYWKREDAVNSAHTMPEYHALMALIGKVSK